MHIDTYEFGRMVVDGKAYTQDLIIFPDRIREKWRRQKGHGLCLKDIADVIEALPEILVVGQGQFGAMRIGKSVAEAIESDGIRLFADKTTEAVRLFNEFANAGHDVVGAFHLTC